MKRLTIAAFIFAFTSFSANAETCESLLLKVNKALEESSASAEQKEKAQKLRDEGEVQKRTGGDCQTPLAQALAMLGG